MASKGKRRERAVAALEKVRKTRGHLTGDQEIELDALMTKTKKAPVRQGG